MRFTYLELIFWILNVLLSLLVLWRMRRIGLWKNFSHFRTFLLVLSLSSLLMQINYRFFAGKYMDWYAYQYIAKSYYLSLFQFLFVAEIIDITLKPFPAIALASKNTLKVFWAIIAVIGVGWFFYLQQLPAGKVNRSIATAIRYQDAACIGFALFLLLTLGFFIWMPVPMSPNARNHSLISTTYFAATALSRFSFEGSGLATIREIASVLGMAATVLLTLGWMLFIHSDDNQVTTFRGPVDREEAERLLARMEELNKSLSRSSPTILR